MSDVGSVVRRIPLSVLPEVDELLERAREVSKVVRVPIPVLPQVQAIVDAYNAENPRRGLRRAAKAAAPVAARAVPDVPGVTVAEAVPVRHQCGRPGSNKTPGPHHYPNCTKFSPRG